MNYKLCGKEIYRKDFCEIFEMCIRDSGGGVRMPGNMIGQPYLETALPAKFLQYGVASAVARYRNCLLYTSPE